MRGRPYGISLILFLQRRWHYGTGYQQKDLVSEEKAYLKSRHNFPVIIRQTCLHCTPLFEGSHWVNPNRIRRVHQECDFSSCHKSENTFCYHVSRRQKLRQCQRQHFPTRCPPRPLEKSIQPLFQSNTSEFARYFQRNTTNTACPVPYMHTSTANTTPRYNSPRADDFHFRRCTYFGQRYK